MDTQTLITKSGNWSDDNLTIPFEKGMDKQIRDMLLDSVEEALKDKEYCCKDPFGTGRFNVSVKTVPALRRSAATLLSS